MVIRLLLGFLQLWNDKHIHELHVSFQPRRCYPTARSETSRQTGIPGSHLPPSLTTVGPDSSQTGRDFVLKMVFFQFVSRLNFNHVFFADEVNKWFRVKPSPLSVQTTSCLSRNNISCPEGQRTIFTYLPAMLSWQETLSASKTSAATPSNDLCLGLDNCKRAMDIAEREFKIPQVAAQLFCKLLNLKLSWNPPQVLEPEHFASPHLDELSGMTYLSYFMKVASRKILTSNFYMNLRRRTALATTPPWIGWNTRSPTPASTTSGWEWWWWWLCWDGSQLDSRL